MSDIPLHERPFDGFLSHAHADKAVVDRVHGWLIAAGLKLWYDATHLSAGAKIATELGQAIPQCRSVIVVMSRASVASGWVEDEWNLASVERNRQGTREFRIVPLRVEECEVPRFLEATKWVDLVGRLDDLSAWADLLDALTGSALDMDVASPTDVYVSRSWQAGREQTLADQILRRLHATNLRLIGDSPDWPSFSGDRIRSIMRSCAGVVCVIPNRPRTVDKDKLKYFIHEARTANRMNLPLLVVAEDGADLPSDVTPQLRSGADGPDARPDLSAALDDALQEFLERCRAMPPAGHVFLATDFDDASRLRNEALRRAIQRCTGLRCVLGEQVSGDTVQRTLIELIRTAVWLLADVSGNNLNTCIEAGIARGAGVDSTLVARKPYQQQPFMLRGMELKTYSDAIELLAITSRSARAYRRNVLRPAGDA